MTSHTIKEQTEEQRQKTERDAEVYCKAWGLRYDAVSVAAAHMKKFEDGRRKEMSQQLAAWGIDYDKEVQSLVNEAKCAMFTESPGSAKVAEEFIRKEYSPKELFARIDELETQVGRLKIRDLDNGLSARMNRLESALTTEVMDAKTLLTTEVMDVKTFGTLEERLGKIEEEQRTIRTQVTEANRILYDSYTAGYEKLSVAIQNAQSRIIELQKQFCQIYERVGTVMNHVYTKHKSKKEVCNVKAKR